METNGCLGGRKSTLRSQLLLLLLLSHPVGGACFTCVNVNSSYICLRLFVDRSGVLRGLTRCQWIRPHMDSSTEETVISSFITTITEDVRDTLSTCGENMRDRNSLISDKAKFYWLNTLKIVNMRCRIKGGFNDWDSVLRGVRSQCWKCASNIL